MKKMIFVLTLLATTVISSDLKPVNTQAGMLQYKSSNYIMHYILFGKMKILLV